MQISTKPLESDELVVVADLLEASEEFENFYNKERKEKLDIIRWFLDLDLPEGIEASADVFKNFIYYKTPPESANDAHTIAHEIMHLIRYKENGILEINPASKTIEMLAGSLNSMLEDSIVDKILQDKYNFNLADAYRKTIEYVETNFKEESSNFVGRLRHGINITNKMLLWDLITDQTALDEWHRHLKWIETNYPHGYKIATEIKLVVDIIGLGTIDQQGEIVLKLIDMYNLGEMISIPEPDI
ncbi:hypothetical protein P0O24_10720 [Methanotrichaceae archaeon M04Ac]|jgi:hypothetical protein|uniref:IrrE N-terminal-like domain-containing protein n=1 Tax=Candidatus Methanocrinis alkalitolerans TaxID=3033395 RepID=A0ABT5XH49_9EURY|nr:hypothetical protein [Candidatus Methanocrinis alkalitolerans]MDF0594052.1 hypothetical protein [Candidatus Methanocrinis alkalitolerans]